MKLFSVTRPSGLAFTATS